MLEIKGSTSWLEVSEVLHSRLTEAHQKLVSFSGLQDGEKGAEVFLNRPYYGYRRVELTVNGKEMRRRIPTAVRMLIVDLGMQATDQLGLSFGLCELASNEWGIGFKRIRPDDEDIGLFFENNGHVNVFGSTVFKPGASVSNLIGDAKRIEELFGQYRGIGDPRRIPNPIHVEIMTQGADWISNILNSRI